MMVGTFAAIALVILSLGVMAVGGKSELFARTTGYRVVFANADGLREASPVKLAGVQVGSVREILLPTDPEAPGIEVRLRVRQEYSGRIRQGTAASLRYLQWLSGEKYVDLTPGDPDLPALPAGSLLPVTESTKLLEQGEDIAQNLSEITVALKDILEPLREGEGLLGEMIHDPEFGREGLARLRGTLENLERLTSQMREGRGFVGRALYDPEFASTIDDFAAAMRRIAALTEALERREGALGDLMDDDGAAAEAVRSLRDAADSIERVARRLEAPEGLLGRLLNDAEYSEALARDLRETARNTAEITRKINEGDGTLGALVNERVLHDGLEDLAAGVDDSKFARWLLRHYRKKGIQAETSTADSEP